jgi:hypothetical protein
MEKACEVCGGKYFAKNFCAKHYRQRPEVKERKKKFRKTPLSVLKNDFFNHFSKYRIRDKGELFVCAVNFSTIACDLTERQRCKLEKIILDEGIKRGYF